MLVYVKALQEKIYCHVNFDEKCR